jgi:uncharacterized membrane protein
LPGAESAPETDLRDATRLEAFSDGVFAIAITLLVLNLKVPPHELPEGETLFQALGHEWATYEAFLVSFATVGVMWISHHRMFTNIRYVDHGLLVLNMLLLLGVTVVPFPTALLAAHRQDKAAAQIFCGGAVLIVLLFNLVWRYARLHPRLLRGDLAPGEIKRLDRTYVLALGLYCACFALSFFSVHASIRSSLALAVYFALPGKLKNPLPRLLASGAARGPDGTLSR